jgi:hypothetical protein
VIRVLAVGVMAVCLGLGPVAQAADLPLLQTSEFNADQDGPAVASTSDASIDLSLVFDAFSANADGPKMEGSSSVIRELKVDKPESVSVPEMRVTMTVFMVKTAPSVARIDLNIADVTRSFVWGRDEVKSGRFEVSFTETIPGGRVPRKIPVSAFALVTKEAPTSVVMVQVESIKLSIGRSRIAGNAIESEATGLWPDLAP